MTINIPPLTSRYIPVYSASFKIRNNLSWWDEGDEFLYNNILLNLDTISEEDIPKLNFPKDMFLLTDSGGFQVIRGNCNYDWKSSLQKQIQLNATKIFSFDIPPVTRANENTNNFIVMTEEETKKIIDTNIEVALKQSQWLKENHPESFKRFCYIAQTTSYETLMYNFKKLKELIGKDNYSLYFPGGLVCSGKVEDPVFYAITTKYLEINFIRKGVYVHYLGIGSFQKMLLMVRNSITTFDSSNVLGGAMRWDMYNPINNVNTLSRMSKIEFPFIKQFCICPVCRNQDYNKLLVDNPELVGRIFIKHNLWYQLQMNMLLDAIDKKIYTDFAKENFKLNDRTKIALDFCDYSDKTTFDIAYDKYKHYLKKDGTKQDTLF